jgi:uncharacterized protein (DUF2236 family)
MSVRQAIAARVRAQFADPAGKRHVTPAPPTGRLLPEGSIAFDVHADVTTMMIGGIASLMLQMLHPKALAGVWDFSNFREDMGGRLRRTAAFIAVTTYGSAADAEAAIARVRRIHARVQGTLPDGTPYRADDPELIAFVGVTEAWGFLQAWIRYRDPLMLQRDQDRYFAEMATMSRRLGAADMPETRRGAEAFLLAMRPQLRTDARTREVLGLLLAQPSATPATAPAQRLLMEAGIDLLPGWARRMHGLSGAGVRTPLLRAGAGGMGAVLRWALAAPKAPVLPSPQA